MPWLPVTQSDLEGWIHPDRLRVAFGARGHGEAGGALNTIVAGVVARIRAKIAQSYPLDPDPNRVPPELHELACLTAASHVLARLGMVTTDATGGVFALTQEQRTRLRKLEEDLDAVARGDMGVTPPDATSDGAAPYSPNRVEVVGRPAPRLLHRGATEGL